MVILLMGVTGAGKTTIGRLLAQQLGWNFVDGDEFHSAANIEKMRRGIPLTDADREPWLAALGKVIADAIAQNNNLVLASSALKQQYRTRLLISPEVRLVYLKGSRDLIAARLRNRHGHFATASLLAGQFADLEEPDDALAVDINGSPDQIATLIRSAFGLG
jgi:gluconokinase